MNDYPFVSIVIPCRNEERFIAQCLDTIIVNDYPKDKIEVFVVDGASEDRTREIIKEYEKLYPFIMLFDNPKRIIPSAMNIGIKNAKGDVIMKIDAHSSFEINYISKCIEYLYKYNADNVGGIIKIIPRDKNFWGESIGLALSNQFGSGNAYFKTGVAEPKWVDTAPFGCYRREVFDRAGLYDENIARCEDVAINKNLRKLGGKILLAPDIIISYYVRSKLIDFLIHNIDNGFWITYPLKFGRIVFSTRHLMPLILASGLICSIILAIFSRVFLWLFVIISGVYFLTTIYYSGAVAFQKKDIKQLFIMPIIFIVLHISYGIGSLWGLIRVLLPISLFKK